MTAHIVFGCDGTRNDMACRGALHTRELDYGYAEEEASRKGWWKTVINGNVVWLCPSSGHNEKKQ